MGSTINFGALFHQEEDKKSALTLFEYWTKSAIDEEINVVSKVVEMFKRHIDGAINVLILHLNNAMAERLNGKIQELKSADKWYRTFDNFRSAILFFHRGLELYPLKSQ